MKLANVGLRGRLLTSVTVAFGLFLAVLTLAFNLVLGARLNADADGVLAARAAAAVSSVAVRGGRLRLPDAPDERVPDARLWVFEGALALERPQHVDRTDDRAAAELAARAPARRYIAATHTRLQAVPVVQGGRRLGTVVVGVSLRPYEETRQTALLGSLALAVAMFLAVALSAAWLITHALRPVARMTLQAADWSEHDLDRRFSLGAPRDELTRLAFMLDRLLDRLAASLRHEQRLSAELSHELRTPLSTIAADAQYTLRHTNLSEEAREAVEQILAAAHRMTQTLDTLIAAARAELDPHRGSSNAAACVRAAVEVVGRAATGAPRVEISIEDDSLRVAVEQALVERMLAPLIENARRHAVETVAVAVARDGDDVQFSIADDGAGVSPEELESIFEPGRRGGAGSTVVSMGAGLGLALARRLARSAGGGVQAHASPRGGLFTVTLPRDQTDPA
ncbi:MAG: two-component system, OmpR family, sensor kinase [Solirubrobacteraceae bacterium]|nr:two-component system, OmpR family, sensor kinase [Solirubrobacteraceae bacterium]